MAEDNSSQNSHGELVERLERLERALQTHTRRLRLIEQHLRLDAREAAPPRTSRRPNGEGEAGGDGRADAHTTKAPPPPTTDAAPAHTPDTAPEPQPQTFADGRPATPPGPQARPTREASAHSTASSASGRGRAPALDLEGRIGGSWFLWVGILAIAFGVAFFLKLAFDSNLIGPAVRVGMGVIAGLGFLVAGELLRGRGLRQYAFALSGGGVLILYLSIYAAYAFYALVPQTVAFLLMTLVTATAVALAARLDALPIAVLALLGGFLTPPLLSTGQSRQVALFGYVALLDAGVLALAYFKRWRSLNFLSFLLTVLTFLGWLVTHYARPELWTTLFFLTLFYALYSLLAVVHNVLKRRAARWLDISLICANASFFYALGYALLGDVGQSRLRSPLALVLSALYTLLYYVAWKGHREDRLLGYTYLGAAVTFFTVAVAVQLDQHWVTVGWAIEALMLAWVGVRSGEAAPRRAALVVFALAIAHWFGWDARDFAYDGLVPEGFVPLLNRRALSCAVLAGALAAAARLYRRAEVGEGERATVTTLFVFAANAVVLTLLTLDISDFFSQRLARVPLEDAARLAQVESTRQFSLTALWATYAACAFWVGVRRKVRAARYGALALLILATIKALALDLSYYAAPWHAPVFNLTFAAFAVLVAAYWLAARLYVRDENVTEDERQAVPVLVVAANVLALTALSAEASGHFGARIAAGAVGVELRDLELARGLSLSVVWAVYGGGLLFFGRLRHNRLLRLMALALLGGTTVKVFFWDLASLDRVYRIISFIVLGAILLAVSYLYQKSQQQRAAEAEEG